MHRGLGEIFDKILKQDHYGFDILDYNDEQLLYDDVSIMQACQLMFLFNIYGKILQAVMVAKLMLPCLGNGQQEHIYLKTMSNITRRQSFWKHVGRYISKFCCNNCS